MNIYYTFINLAIQIKLSVQCLQSVFEEEIQLFTTKTKFVLEIMYVKYFKENISKSGRILSAYTLSL